MRATVRPEWTFEEPVDNACATYGGHGVESADRRNRLFRQWAELVGRERAVAELDRFVRELGGIAEAADQMRITPSTLKALRKDFRTAADVPVVATRGPALGYEAFRDQRAQQRTGRVKCWDLFLSFHALKRSNSATPTEPVIATYAKDGIPIYVALRVTSEPDWWESKLGKKGKDHPSFAGHRL